MSKEQNILALLGIQVMTFITYGLPLFGFLQTKQLISLVVYYFAKIQEEAIAFSCLSLATPMEQAVYQQFPFVYYMPSKQDRDPSSKSSVDMI